MSTYQIPDTLYRGTGDYSGLACSEPDPYAPLRGVVYWVATEGGPVTVDILRSAFNTVADGDPWLYDQPTGITLTAAEVADRIDQ
jgi:hypothetical protein